MGFDDLTERMRDSLDHVQDYFSQLSAEERYGWVAEGLGFALLVAGIVMLIL